MSAPDAAVMVSVVGAIASLVNTFMILNAKKTVTLLEKNTNSIKDELVRVVGQAEHAKGLKQGQEEGRT